MMDQSFDAFGGVQTNNGWGGAGGDVSFVATQATPKANDYDRVALPVTVKTLNNLDASDEKIQFGNYSFSQVRVIGTVVSKTEANGEIRYMICDHGNEDQNPFMIVQYFGVDAETHPAFIEGTTVHAIGKIRSFDGQSAILAFKVLEVMDTHIRDVFPKEARVAELYFTKGCPEKYAANEMTSFVGTFLSPEAPQSNNRNNPAATTPGRNVPFGGNAATPGVMNGSALYGSTQHQGRGNNPQQNRILEYFSTHQVSGDTGLSIAVVRAGVRGDANFDNDIDELAQNGVIYTTVDDTHYAIIAE